MNSETETVLCENCKVMINKNITSENNKFIYFVNGDQYILTIPEGYYEIRTLCQEIQKQMQENNHKDGIEIIPNINTFHSILKIKKYYAVQFSNKSKTFHKILGFEAGIYSERYHDENHYDASYISQNPINITGK